MLALTAVFSYSADTEPLAAYLSAVPVTVIFSWAVEEALYSILTYVTAAKTLDFVIYGVEALGGYSANVLLFRALSIGALLAAYGVAVSLGVSRWRIFLGNPHMRCSHRMWPLWTLLSCL